MLNYLLVQKPHISHLPLVFLMQPPELLAGLLHMVVLSNQLDVVLPHSLQLFFQLVVVTRQTSAKNISNTRKVLSLRKPFLTTHQNSQLQKKTPKNFILKGMALNRDIFLEVISVFQKGEHLSGAAKRPNCQIRRSCKDPKVRWDNFVDMGVANAVEKNCFSEYLC